MAASAIALASSVAAAYSYSQSAAPAALLFSLLFIPFCRRAPGKNRIFAFAAEIIILFGAVLRLAALGALVCAKHGGFAAAALVAACAAAACKLAVTGESALYASAPALFFCFAALAVPAAFVSGEAAFFNYTALPDPVSFPAALFCPLSAALSAGILSQACAARRVKGCALGTAAVCAMLLFPAAANVFPFVYVTLCVCQFALELRTAATLFTRK